MTYRPASAAAVFTAVACVLLLGSPPGSALAGTGAPIQPTESPGLWVAPLESGATIQDAWLAGAAVLDHFPDALVIGDRASYSALVAAGFRLDGPLDVTPGGSVSLLRSRHAQDAVDLTAVAALTDVRILWSDGRNVIVESIGGLPDAAPAVIELGKKTLRSRPIQRPARYAPEAAGSAPTTSFPALVDEMVAQVDAQAYIDWMGNLAGAATVMIGGSPHFFTSRYTDSSQCDLAEQYVFERFQAMGFTDVEYDPFSFSGTNGRNVIATLPGTETPDRIYIICGHLDSTSPDPYNAAPGANDNASGTATVLAAAEIMAGYQFRSTVKFIAFTGEEQGLRGSRHYAQAAAAAGDSIMGVVNCDMVAWYDQQYAIDIEGGWDWDWLMQIMNDACAEYTPLGTNLTYFSWGSDHVSFQDEGYAAFLAIETEWADYPCYHRTCDLTDINDADFGADVTRASMATIAYLAEPVPMTGLTSTGVGRPALRLFDNRPNPFNPFTTIRFELPSPSTVALSIHDVTGRLVRTLLEAPLEAGEHVLAWDGTSTGGRASASGVYFYTLNAGGESITKRLVLAR